ncbi:Chitinase 1 [Allomyces javanicus]|nr:Chitinase 1 [Allomyces javanicus]
MAILAPSRPCRPYPVHAPIRHPLLPVFLFAAILLATTAGVSAAPPSPRLIAYWGQDKAASLYAPSSGLTEPSLTDLCTNAPGVTHVHLASLRAFNSLGNLPAIDFSTHCTWPTDAAVDAWRSGPQPTSGFALLRCPAVADGIAACQRAGKKVYLTISPMTSLPVNQAATAAQNVWNLFFGGTHSLRPFGSTVSLDGIDLAMRTNDYDGYPVFVMALKQLAAAANYPLGVTVSPRCDFPDAMIGPTYPGRLLTNTSSEPLVDTINYFATSSPSCSAGSPVAFESTLAQWTAYTNTTAKSLSVTFPGLGGGYEAYFEAMTGDYIPASTWLNLSSPIVTALASAYAGGSGPLAGVALYDLSTDAWGPPCTSVTARSRERRAPIARTVPVPSVSGESRDNDHDDGWGWGRDDVDARE